jgi:membrane fusion protein, multidrug efflux system
MKEVGIMSRYCSLFFFTGFIFLFLACFPGVVRSADEYHECMIEPYREVKISSQVSGIVDEVLVERGDIVKKGQIVATLRSGVEKANVAQAQAQVDFNKRRLERNKVLFEKEHLSVHEKDEIETEIRKGEALLQEAIEKLEMKNIKSTVDGVVVKRDLNAGEYIGDKSILTIAQISPLNVEVVVPVRQYGSITKGMNAEVRPEAPVGGSYSGKVTIVDKTIHAASGTFGVRVELPNTNMKLPAGLKCKVRFLGPRRETENIPH